MFISRTCYNDDSSETMTLTWASEYVTYVPFQHNPWTPGAEVIKLFSCSTQLSMKFIILINIKIAKIDGIFWFNSLEPAIYPANKC